MKSQKNEKQNSLVISKENKEIIDRINKSLEEDKHLTEEELEEKYGGLNLAWD